MSDYPQASFVDWEDNHSATSNNRRCRKKLPPLNPHEISPFIIDLSPCTSASSTPPATPSAESIFESSLDYFTEPSPLAVLLAKYRNSISKHQESEAEEQSAHERAVLNYLHNNAATAADVRLLIPEFNIYPFALVNKMVNNIGLYYSRGKISQSELEAINLYLLTQGSRQVDVVLEKVWASVDRFKKQAAEWKRSQKVRGKGMKGKKGNDAEVKQQVRATTATQVSDGLKAKWLMFLKEKEHETPMSFLELKGTMSKPSRPWR